MTIEVTIQGLGLALVHVSRYCESCATVTAAINSGQILDEARRCQPVSRDCNVAAAIGAQSLRSSLWPCASDLNFRPINFRTTATWFDQLGCARAPLALVAVAPFMTTGP